MKRILCILMSLMILMGLVSGCTAKPDIDYLVLVNKENRLPQTDVAPPREG